MTEDEANKLRKELLFAYQLIRAQTIQICDLHSLVAPLILALDPALAEARLRALETIEIELDREKSGSLALIDQAILRLKAN